MINLRILAQCLTVVLCVISANVSSIGDAEILKGLETLGEWKVAYPLAQKLAQQQNTYLAWRHLAVKYAQFDTNKEAYVQTWQQACQLNQIEIYKDFITLSPDSPLNLLAIQAIFKLTQATNDIQAYRSFMETFPMSVEALQALMQVHELAFARTQQLNHPEIYDAFIVTFPGAKQVVQAIEEAYQVEKKAVLDALNGKSPTEIALLARRLYNEARVAEKEKIDNPSVARKYRLLLEIDTFKETTVVTELLDREERLAFQKLMLNHQTQIDQSIQRMQAAIVQAIQVQTKDLGDLIVKQSEIQQHKLDELIVVHQQMLVEISQAVKAQVAHSIIDGAGKTATVVSSLAKTLVTEEKREITSTIKSCQVLGRVTDVAASLTPVTNLAKTPIRLGAVMVCESIPFIAKFIKDFF